MRNTASEIKTLKKNTTVDSTVLLSFLLCPLLLLPILFTDRWLCTSPPTHLPPFCHANHDKPSAAPGAVAFGSAAFGSAAFGLAAFSLMYL